MTSSICKCTNLAVSGYAGINRHTNAGLPIEGVIIIMATFFAALLGSSHENPSSVPKV